MRTARLTQALKMLILSASLSLCLLKGGHLIAAPRPVPGVGSGYDIEMSRMIPMRDGVELAAWIFKPSQLKIKAPTVFELTQYDIDGGRHRDFAAFTQRGYVFVRAYVRGGGRSGGA